MPNKGIFEKTSLSESKNYESDTENRAGCQEQGKLGGEIRQSQV
jgi:hypothetical protein